MKMPDDRFPGNDVTRRQWLLRLGEMVALAGVSGLIPESPARIFGSDGVQAQLPPGLYEPSAQDLVHALTAHKAFTPPVGCETDYAQLGSLPFEPQFFSQDEFPTIARMAELLLGQVDPNALAQTTQWIDLWFHSSKSVREAAHNLDPLHRALAVEYFGEASIRELESTDPQAIARSGISDLQKLCLEKHNRAFPDLDPSTQTEILHSLAAAEPQTQLRKFFNLLRTETIRGYYTSAEGLRELDYKGNTYHPYCPGCELTSNQSKE